MGCGWLLALPFKIAGTLAIAGALLLVVSGFRIRHSGFCALGSALGVVGLLLGPGWLWWVSLAPAVAGGVGYWKYRRQLPHR